MKTKSRVKKRIYYVRMETVGFIDVKVLAKNKDEAGRLANEYSHRLLCQCDGFESGEISETPIGGFNDTELPTEDEPVVLD